MKLWVSWVLACTLAFGIGGTLGAELSPSTDLIVTGWIALSASLLLAGVLQWLVLRPLISNSGRWLQASVGAVAIFTVSAFGLGLINRDVGWVLGVVIGWIALAVLQWMVLRKHVAKAGWWVLANVLALIAAGPVVGLISWAIGASVDTSFAGLIRWLAFGAAYGIVTGTWLARRQFERGLS